MTIDKQVILTISGEDSYLNSIVYTHLIDFLEENNYYFSTNSLINEISIGESNYDFKLKNLIDKHGERGIIKCRKDDKTFKRLPIDTKEVKNE